MNEIRGKFIDDLGDQLELSELPDSEAILEDYIIAYDEKLAKGMTDMEIVIALGDPADIVKTLRRKPHSTEEERKASISDIIREAVSVLSKPAVTPASSEKKIIQSVKIQPTKIVPNKLKETPKINEPTVIAKSEAKIDIKTEKIVPTPKDKKKDRKQILEIKPQEAKPESKKEERIENIVPINNSDKITENVGASELQTPEKTIKKEKTPKIKQKVYDKEKKPKQKVYEKERKGKPLVSILLYIVIVITTIIIPIGIIFSGLTFLLPLSLMTKINDAAVSLGGSIVAIIINHLTRKLVRNMVINKNK